MSTPTNIPVIVETDIGRDPDDVFALLYLVQARCDLRAVAVSPGDADQVALARWLLTRVGLGNVPVGRARDLPEKRSLSEPHVRMLRSDGAPREAEADGFGVDVIEQALADCPDATLFVCGPPKNTGALLARRAEAGVGPLAARVTVQGGFAGYRVAEEAGVPLAHRLEKFEGRETVATFNLGGDRNGAALLLSDVVLPAFIGKNVCHTIFYTPEQHEGLRADTDVLRLWKRLMDDYLAEHPAKAMHDVTAAVGHLHPELFRFFEGELYRERGEYGTRPCDPPRHRVALDVDRDGLWDSVLNGR